MPLTLPDFILDAHQRYKRRNAAFTDWMLQNAGPAVEPGPTIRIARLVPVAQHLVTRGKPPLDVPTRVLDALQKTITLRERCTSWYKSKTLADAALVESNQRHEYFTNVLKDVRRILEAHRTSARMPTGLTSARGGKGPTQKQTGQFKFLAVEQVAGELSSDAAEPDEGAAITTPDTVRRSPSVHDKGENMDEVTTEADDPHMALFLMLEMSLDPLRQLVLQKWKEYHAGKIHLMTLSVIMNTAILFAQRIESKFLARFPKFGNWADEVPRELLSKTIYSPFFQQFCQFRENYRQFQGPKFRRTSDLSQEQPLPMSDNLRVGNTKLTELLIGVLLLRIHRETLPTQDELIHGLKEAFAGDKISLWVLFGLQLFVDKLQVLDRDVSQGFRQLRATANKHASNRENHVLFAQTVNGGELSKKRIKRIFSNVRLIDRWVTTDKFTELQGLESKMEPRLGMFSFFSHNALASGVLQSGVLLNMRRGGLELVNADKLVLAMAHLYNVLRCEERLEIPWRDMDKFLALHAQEILVDRKPPKSFRAHEACFRVAIQGSILSIVPKSRSLIKASLRTQKNPGQIARSKIMGTFEGLLCPEESSKDEVTLTEIEEVLLRSIQRKGGENINIAEDPAYAQWHDSHKLEPERLLQVLEERLEEELPKVLFDYEAFHHMCWTLLAEIEPLMRDGFRKWLIDRFESIGIRAINLRWLPLYILEDAMLDSSSSNAPGGASREGDESPRRNALSKARDVLWKFLMEKGADDQTDANGVIELGPAVLWGILDP